MNKNHSSLFNDYPSPPLREQPRCRAFTLTEILVAIALVVIVAGVSVAGLYSLLDHGRGDTAKIFFDSAKTALLAYRLDEGTFPSTDQGLRALVSAPEDAANWRGPYLDAKNVPLDGWNTPFQYAYPGPHNGPGKYDLWSAGPDKISGTADDIGNW